MTGGRALPSVSSGISFRSGIGGRVRGGSGFEMEIAGSFWSQGRAAPLTLPQHSEYGIQSVDLHLVDHLEQRSETAFGEAAFGREPGQIFHGQIVYGDAVWGMVRGTVLAEGHTSAPDFLQVALHLFRQALVHRGRIGYFLPPEPMQNRRVSVRKKSCPCEAAIMERTCLSSEVPNAA